MTDAVLALNAGSSTLKFRLVETRTERSRAGGTVERTADGPADGPGSLDEALEALQGQGHDLGRDGSRLAAVVHRVVHGGDRFTGPVRVDDEVRAALEELVPLAPLHNPAGLAGLDAARERFPGVPQVAVFDTAFHGTLPPHAATYAVPEAWRTEHGVRRYGFHGISYQYVTREAARLLDRPLARLDLVALHLGNGCSAAAVAGGRSVDTSMGMTPLEGLVMGSRSGDVDPALPGHLHRVAGLSPEEVDDALNHASGLRALAGDPDMRMLLRRRAEGDPRAAAAFDVYCYRIRTYVGAYAAALGGLDAVVFTGGVGQNAAPVRAAALAGLEVLGVRVDEARNAAASGREPAVVSADDSWVSVLVVPTDEELEMARQAIALLRGPGHGH